MADEDISDDGRTETRDDIRLMIREEVDRSAVRAALAAKDAPAPTRAGAISRHPLFLALIAFIMTTIVGGTFNEAMKQRNLDHANHEAKLLKERDDGRARHERAYQAEKDAIVALGEFVRLVYTRTVAADLLRTAVMRGAPTEATVKKFNYDATYTAWNVGIPQQFHELRRLTAIAPDDMAQPSPYEIAAFRALDGRFGLADDCLTNAYDAARRTGFPPLTVFKDKACKTDNTDGAWWVEPENQSHLIHKCTRTILEEISAQVRVLTKARADGTPLPDPQVISVATQAMLDKFCGAPK
jgi:hypothetical protein